ncbi:Ran-binding-domain-containing protein [Tothia fuscella]|uniref:Ran-binding-domain-containing protein n=1 Tax=Tothia fuscella TaxID=1048955 RepID=A0A9P4NXD0_9PEZI|nr:Ran-binding-domain-containing protein [Tothia fuscella]
MDALLGNITHHAMNYAIRTGITITSGFAIQQCSKLLRNVKGSEKEEITTLQLRLESKIRIISPAIDMIELIAARGNTSLESAVSLTKQIRLDIQDLGIRLSKATTDEQLLRRKSSRAKSREQMDVEIQLVIRDMKRLLERIEDAVPLINLAITTSGVSLSTTLPSTVSPSRLLQASTFLTAGDTSYVTSPATAVQIGPVFVLSIYMLFAAHAFRPQDDEGVRETTWQEVIHKARVKLMRVPLDKLCDLPNSRTIPLGRSTNGSSPLVDGYFPADIPSEGKAFEFAYQLLIIEDFDDDRVHDDEKQEPFEDVARAGIREVIPIHEISKIFYADTGKILNIGGGAEPNNPILLLKRDPNAVPPRRMVERDGPEPDEDSDGGSLSERDSQSPPNKTNFEDGSPHIQLHHDPIGSEPDVPTPALKPSRKWRFPPNLDPEWMALEVYNEALDSDDEEPEDSLDSSSSPAATHQASYNPMFSAFSRLKLRGSASPASSPPVSDPKSSQIISAPSISSPAPVLKSNLPALPALRSSLSLLELLIRLTALQQFQQSSHLTINDELLNFFLSESATTGAGADNEYRRKARRDARRRVGFDPFDESPIKRRSEEYIGQRYDQASGEWANDDYEYNDSYNEKTAVGAFDGEWKYGSGGGTPRSARNSPGLRSPNSPSPSLRQSIPARSKSSPAPESLRQPTFHALETPQSVGKGRSDMLRKEGGPGKSPLSKPMVRSESDSTLGTSPSAVEDEEK